MDAQLRTRLIGAAVLFGLLAIFLPMFLHTDEVGNDPLTASETQQIPLDIPAQPEPGMQTRVLPIEPAAPAADVPAAREDNPAEVAAPVPPDVPPVASETQGSIPREPANSPPDLAQSNSQETNQSNTTANSNTVVRLPTPTAGGRYGVNFGSYGSQDNAEKLIDQLATVKIKASIEPVPDKNLFRVALRGLATRADAEKIRLVAQDEIAGLAASILQGELANNAAPATVRPANVGAFAVQIGVFSDKIKAAELIGNLKSKGFPAFAENVTTPSGSSVRVRVGPMLNRADADKVLSQIKAKAGLDGIVVSGG